MSAPTTSSAGPEFYEGHDLQALADLPHYYAWILETFAPYLKGRVLEVGPGRGNFSAHYVQDAREVVLLEPARNLFPALEQRFANAANVHPVCGLLEDWCESVDTNARPRQSSFDTTVLVNVLEHVEDDRGMVLRLGQLLRPGGALLIFVPALRWLYGSLDTVVHHHRRYTFSQLRRLIRRCGLELVHLRYFDLAGIVPWMLTGRVLRQRHFNPTAATVYDRFVVPVTSRLENWARLPFGKNLICVARRPEMQGQATTSHRLPRAA